jgi:hypothetical protein
MLDLRATSLPKSLAALKIQRLAQGRRQKAEELTTEITEVTENISVCSVISVVTAFSDVRSG